MSIIFLKRKQYAHHWLGVILIVGGVAGVGAVALTLEESESGGNVGFGIVLIVIA